MSASPLVQPFSLPYRYRGLLLRAVKNEIKQKNAGSVLGVWWLVLSPVIVLGIYTVLYTVIFKVKPPGMPLSDYILHMFAGLLPMLTVSESLSAGTGSLVANKNLLKNTVFPPILIPLRTVLAGQVSLVIGLLMLAIASIALGHFGWGLLMLPIVFICHTLFVTGIVWLLSLLNLFFRDIQNLIAYIMTVLIVLSPIAYTPDMVPKALKIFLYLNPAAYFVISYQGSIVDRQLLHTPIPWAMLGLSIIFFLVGFAIFRRMQAVLSNYA